VIWDADTTEEIARFDCQPGQVFALRFSPDESKIGCGGLGGDVRLRDLSSGADTTLSAGQAAGSLDFSPDGAIVAVGYSDGTVHGWGVQGGTPVFEFRAGGSAVTLVAFMEGEQRLLTVTSKGHLGIWDVGSGKELRESELQSSDTPVALDGDTLAFWMKDRVQLWSVSNWGPIESVQVPAEDRAPHPFPIALRDSHLAVAQSSKASVWDTRTGSLAWPTLDGRGSVNDIAFDPRGNRVAVVGATPVVSIWDLAWEKWVSIACRVAGRSLSQEEWQEHLGDDPYQDTCGSHAAPVSASTAPTLPVRQR
jgi:hypothetical protein